MLKDSGSLEGGKGMWATARFEYSTTVVLPGQTRARLINGIWVRHKASATHLLARARIIDWGAQSRETQERTAQGGALYAKLPVELWPPEKLQ